eukprot:1820433-Pleurochrysis_carterae.AAC.2
MKAAESSMLFQTASRLCFLSLELRRAVVVSAYYAMSAVLAQRSLVRLVHFQWQQTLSMRQRSARKPFESARRENHTRVVA